MTPETFIIAKASEAIQALYGVEVPEAQLQVQVTRKEFEGDYTLVVFPLLKVSKTTPENTGNAIGEWLKTNVAEVSGYNTVKGFLNISFSEVYWNNVLAAIAAAEDYGQLEPTGKTIMVEYSSPNTNKPLHLGHIRNNLLGWSVAKLEIIHACSRGENIVVIFINNGIYGMTGGQMAPTTLLGMKTATTPYGRDAKLNGFPLVLAPMIAQLDGTAFITRQAVHTAAAARKAKAAIKKAFEYSQKGIGLSFVEIVATCNSGWKLSPTAANKWMVENMFPKYPLGDIKDVLKQE